MKPIRVTYGKPTKQRVAKFEREVIKDAPRKILCQHCGRRISKSRWFSHAVLCAKRGERAAKQMLKGKRPKNS